MNNCFYCDLIISEADNKFMYGLDRPYINLWFHKDCFKILGNCSWDEFISYFISNLDRILSHKDIRK